MPLKKVKTYKICNFFYDKKLYMPTNVLTVFLEFTSLEILLSNDLNHATRKSVLGVYDEARPREDWTLSNCGFC